MIQRHFGSVRIAFKAFLIALIVGCLATLSCASAKDAVIRGDEFFTSGQYDEAIEEYVKALEIDPEHASANYKIGNAYLEIGRLDLAESNYRTAILINPDLPDPSSGLGIFYYTRANGHLEAGRPTEAEADYDKALHLNPDLPDPYSGLGTFYYTRANGHLEAKRPTEAEADYDKALRLNPDLPDPYSGLGTFYYTRANGHLEAGQAIEAEADYDKALHLNPDLPDPYSGLGTFYYTRANGHLKAKRPTKAEADYDRALRLNPNLLDPYPNLSKYYYDRGNAYTEKQEHELAEFNLQKAVRLNPANTSYKSKLDDVIEAVKELDSERERQRIDSITTVGQLTDQWHENEVAFENKFIGKRIELIGYVGSVQSRTLEPGYRVTMREDFATVDCNVAESYRDKVASLKQGQIIEVTGIVDHGFIGPDLYDCLINRVHNVRN